MSLPFFYRQGMGIYSHLSEAELTAKRNELLNSLERVASGVASVSSNGRSVSYHTQSGEVRRLLNEVNAELTRRAGGNTYGPIYLVGR